MNSWFYAKVMALGLAASAVLAITPRAYAGNFGTVQENGATAIECIMDHDSEIALDHAVNLNYGDQPLTAIFLKNAVAGTRVLADGHEVTKSIPDLTLNGYQGFWVPKDEYQLTLVRPDGSKLEFTFLRT